ACQFTDRSERSVCRSTPKAGTSPTPTTAAGPAVSSSTPPAHGVAPSCHASPGHHSSPAHNYTPPPTAPITTSAELGSWSSGQDTPGPRLPQTCSPPLPQSLG